MREIGTSVGELGLRGMGETHIRSLTAEMHPELIARDLEPLMLELARHGVPLQLQTAWTQWKGGLWFGDPLWVDEIAGRLGSRRMPPVAPPEPPPAEDTAKRSKRRKGVGGE